MPLKLIHRDGVDLSAAKNSSSPLEHEQGTHEDQPKNQSSWLANTAKQVGTGVLGSVGSTVQSVLDIDKGIENYRKDTNEESTKSPIPTVENVRKYFGVEEPEGFLQDTLDFATKTLPITVLLGGSNILGAIGSDLVSSAAASATKHIGGGPLAQAAAGFLTGVGLNKAKNLITKTQDPESLIGLAKTAEKKHWTSSEKLGNKINKKVPEYKKGLEKIRTHIEDTTSLKEAQKSELLSKIDKYVGDVPFDIVNAGKLTSRIKEINSVIGEKAPKVYKTFLERIQSDMFKTAEKIGKKNKRWFKDWSKAREITQALHYQSAVGDLIDEYPKLAKVLSNPLAKSLITGSTGALTGGAIGGLPGVVVGAGLASAGTAAIKKAEQIAGFLKKESTHSLLRHAFKNTAKRNVPEIAKSWLRVNKEAEKYQEEHGNPFNPSPSKLKLIHRES